MFRDIQEVQNCDLSWSSNEISSLFIILLSNVGCDYSLACATLFCPRGGRNRLGIPCLSSFKMSMRLVGQLTLSLQYIEEKLDFVFAKSFSTRF